jgi:hypothetical protein
VAQDRLFRLAVEAGTINFWHEPAKGWSLVVKFRRGDERWDEATHERYDHLSTLEMLETLYASLDGAL